MLGGILAGLRDLARLPADLTGVEPEDLSRRIATLFAQFERLVHSTREFYAYLTQVLSRFDLERSEFQAFKTALLDYLQRFVDEVARHMPQIAEAIDEVRPLVPLLCARANAGQRLVDLEGRAARRAPGLDPADWDGLVAWFAETLADLRVPPGNRLEALQGDRVGQHSIRINDQWRICFVWTGSGPTDVEIVDYH